MQYGNGTVYTGEWKRGMRNGHGTVEYCNGTVYTGGWKEDKEYGFGTMTYENGDVCEGEWSGFVEYQGTLTKEDGKVFKGFFLDGELLHGVVRPVNGPEYTVGKGVGARGFQVVSLANATPQPLRDETIESIVQQYCNLHFGDTLGDLRAEYGPATLAPLHTLVLYMPDTGSARLADLCESLRGLTLSVFNLSSAKSPSALKK
ncbi:hypothetical protein KIPB_011217, partial [Kipferlia bialata]|eukprot:g11217.t1